MCLYTSRLRTRRLGRRAAEKDVREGVRLLRDGVSDLEPPFTDPAALLLADLDLDSPWDDLSDHDLIRLYAQLYGETLLLDEERPAAVH